MSDPVVFAEVHGADGAALRRFYGELFGWALQSYGDAMDYGMAPPGEESGQGYGLLVDLAEMFGRDAFYVADEAFICGTGYGIVPVVSVDGLAVGDGLVGPHTRRLMNLYGRAVRGDEDRYAHWLLPIHR